MSKGVEKWEYGELAFFGVLPNGATEPITKYTARTGGSEPIYGTEVEQFTVMNSFGRRGWRLRQLDELVTPAESDKQAQTLDALSRIEELTGTPGTVISVTRFLMARRLK